MRLFKLVERLLVEDEKYRNDDLPLHLKIWEFLGIIRFEYEFVGNSAVRKKYPLLITDSQVLGKVIGHDTIRRSRHYSPVTPKIPRAIPRKIWSHGPSCNCQTEEDLSAERNPHIFRASKACSRNSISS